MTNIGIYSVIREVFGDEKEGADDPDKAMLWPDGTAMRWPDGSFMIWPT